MTGTCSNCIKPRVCHIPDYLSSAHEVGWCADCNTCSKHDCNIPIAFRIEWPSSVGTLVRDVCAEHKDNGVPNCHCSEGAPYRALPYVWEE